MAREQIFKRLSRHVTSSQHKSLEKKAAAMLSDCVKNARAYRQTNRHLTPALIREAQVEIFKLAGVTTSLAENIIMAKKL